MCLRLSLPLDHEKFSNPLFSLLCKIFWAIWATKALLDSMKSDFVSGFEGKSSSSSDIFFDCAGRASRADRANQMRIDKTKERIKLHFWSFDWHPFFFGYKKHFKNDNYPCLCIFVWQNPPCIAKQTHSFTLYDFFRDVHVHVYNWCVLLHVT